MNSARREADLAAVRALEVELLEPSTRADPERVARLLHPDFVEIGASGSVWGRDTVIRSLAADPGRPVEASGLSASVLSEDVVLVTYIASERPGRKASRRSSLWVRVTGRWQVRFHQGTALASHSGDASQRSLSTVTDDPSISSQGQTRREEQP
jgi:ribonuclease HI